MTRYRIQAMKVSCLSLYVCTFPLNILLYGIGFNFKSLIFRQLIAVSDIYIYLFALISFRSKSKEPVNERRAGLSTYFAKSRIDWRGNAADIQFPELLSDKMDESTCCQKSHIK